MISVTADVRFDEVAGVPMAFILLFDASALPTSRHPSLPRMPCSRPNIFARLGPAVSCGAELLAFVNKPGIVCNFSRRNVCGQNQFGV